MLSLALHIRLFVAITDKKKRNKDGNFVGIVFFFVSVDIELFF